MLKIVLVGIVLISYIGILYSISKERPKPKLLIFWLIVFLMITLCIIGIEINNQEIIEHSINCHCYE